MCYMTHQAVREMVKTHRDKLRDLILRDVCEARVVLESLGWSKPVVDGDRYPDGEDPYGS